MALDMDTKKEIMAKFGNDEKDTGSPAVQVALLSARIKTLTEHLQTNKKDHDSKLGMLKLVGQRRRLMRYLKSKDVQKFKFVVAELGLRDNIA